MYVKILNFFKAGSDQPPLVDENQINKKYSKYRKEVLASIIVLYGFGYTCRLALSVVKKPLIDNGIFSIIDLGLVGSAYFYGYALGKFINGFLADYANIKKFFTFGLIISGAINISMGLNQSLPLWIVFWFLNGWVQGIGAPSCAIALTNWFSPKERGWYYGLWSTAHSIGEGLTFIVTAALVDYLSWHAGFIGPGISLILITAVGYRFLQDSPSSLGLPSISVWKKEIDIKKLSNNFSEVLKNQLKIIKYPSIWILGLASSTMYITRYAINSWGILYLQEARGYSLIEAGGLVGLNTFTGIIGCIAYGFISDKYFNARRPPVTLMFGVAEIISLFLIFFGPQSTFILTIAFIIYGFTLSGLLAVLGGLFAIDIAPKNISGAAMGFIGLFSYIGAGIQEKISSVLIKTSQSDLTLETIYNFDSVIIFWISASIVSFFLALSLWNYKTKD
ncbi:MAG: MFS transporter [Candidatus Neomarinimicrobiota bacterium]|nr:MAG: MFS transporter [bacterium]|tara:strand:+ start:6890 stop:8236 length:1347 start_codon:yes stop_codon:yes gene_type:complete